MRKATESDRVMFRRRAGQICSSVLTLMLSVSALAAQTAQQSGYVRTGETPIASSTVTLYSAGDIQNAAPAVFGKATSDARGFFNIHFNPPSDTDAVLYLIADGGSVATARHGNSQRADAIRLATVLGRAPFPATVAINERTTAASAYAMAQFIDGIRIAGKAPGLQNAAATLRNLVNLSSGQVGAVLANPPNGSTTSTMREFNSLANLLASCINAPTPGACNALFRLAAPPDERAPEDTLQAAVDIAHFPGHNAGRLFLQSLRRIVYTPALVLAPNAWTLAIRYNGNGHEMDGPGNMVFDKDGNIWSTNNYEFNSDPHESVCAGKTLIKLTPTGEDAPGAPYSGGGINGAGFGITLDPNGDVWVGNFGFKGKGCTETPPSNSVSEFSADGTPLSPDTVGSAPGGFTEGPISQPQGTVSDQSGNIWIANCGSDSVTQYPNEKPENRNFSGIGLSGPFGTAIDAEGNAWITGNSSDNVAALAADGTPLTGSPFTGGGISAPLGIAVDSLDNVWVANSGGVPIGSVLCGTPRTPGGKASVTEITRDGRRMRSFTGGGQTIPWGIAVDGNDNIWVANFGGQCLTELCGSRPSNCPPRHNTGDAISPDTGYSFDGLTRNTGVAIDPSGNVWLANNWLNVPFQTNPGGHELVVFIGLAAPVKAPLIGPPQQP
jgi:sugar lactone lactonase YvrE